jgi:hypothetical protein
MNDVAAAAMIENTKEMGLFTLLIISFTLFPIPFQLIELF